MALVRPFDLIVTFEPDGRIFMKSGSRGAGAKAPPFFAAILAACSVPRERAEIAQAMGPQAAEAYDGLAAAGFLVPPEEAMATPVLFANYAGIEVHRRMLVDEQRLDKYNAGLQAVVREGDVVIDAGSGTGILATMAALAGAARVYAIEQSDFADVIPHVAEASGVGDKVIVVRGDIGRVELPEKARVMVTETFGAWAYAEDPCPDVGACVKRNMVEDAVVVPNAVTLWAAGMPEAPPNLTHPFRRRHDGVDLTPLLTDARGRGTIMEVAADAVGAPCRVTRQPFPGPHHMTGQLHLDAPCEALAVWFDLHMAPGVDLPCGPDDPWTHWKQQVLPFELEAGDYEVHIGPAPEDRRTLLIEIDGHEVRLR